MEEIISKLKQILQDHAIIGKTKCTTFLNQMYKIL